MRKGIFLALWLLPTTAWADVSQNYEPEWDHGLNRDVALALAANNIRGCGQFKHKRHIQGGSEYIVYCTGDGHNWVAYIVFAAIQKVMGPYPPSPEFD